jgi:serine/threonine protein kinase
VVQALESPTYDVEIFKWFRQLCGRVGLLPASHLVPGKFIKTAEHPIVQGGFGDVWEGRYGDKRVAIKALRIYKEGDVQKTRKVTHPAFLIPLTPPANYHHQVFCKEVVMWRKISHPNIVPFLGLSEALVPLCMVSEWMPNGNVQDYVAKNPEISRVQLVC